MVFVLHFKCIDDFAREAVAREVVYSDKLKKKIGGGGWGWLIIYYFVYFLSPSELR